MRFVKLHGTGNDFIVVDGRTGDSEWPAIAERICDRHVGVGADGLLVALPSEAADLRMALYNADGSEAETSGNGVRCFVKYAVDGGLASLRDSTMTIETLAGVITVTATVADDRVTAARVGMGRPRFAPQEIPVAVEAEPPITELPLAIDDQTLAVACLSMGNPHAVHFIQENVDDFPLETIGPRVERHALFPSRINFEVAQVQSRERIVMRVWERGVGPTLSCGTGAAAVMVAARLRELVGNKAELLVPGGALTLEWDGEGEVYLTGPVAEVFTGEWPE